MNNAGLGSFLTGFSGGYAQAKQMQKNAPAEIAPVSGGKQDTGKDTGALGMPTGFKGYGEGATAEGPAHAAGATGGLGLPASAAAAPEASTGAWGTIASLFSGN